MKLSIVINCDTRSGFQNESSQATGLFNGCTSEDFIVDATINKIKFFEDFDKEIILHVDRHNDVPTNILEKLQEITDTLVVRKHTNENSFNDISYLRALQLATGDIVVHFDQDTAAFTGSKDVIDQLIILLDEYKFVSYPSYWSPRAITDESFGSRTWASTRFFMCKRETLNFDALRKCIEEPEWAYATYGDSPRRCNWLEHFLTLTNNDSCFYPPMDIDNYTIFSWGRYTKGTLQQLNNMSYPEIRNWLNSHDIHYPNDVDA